MTDEVKALVKQIAWEVGEAVEKRLDEAQKERLKLHAATCPVLSLWKNVILIVSGLMGLVTVAALVYGAVKGH